MSYVMGNTDNTRPFSLQINALKELQDINLEELGVRGLIFDYGGTLDSRGEHWSRVIRKGYEHAGLEVPFDDFMDAYIHAERELARVPHISPSDNFLDLMRKKISIELGRLEETDALHSDAGTAEAISMYCYNIARECTSESRQVLGILAERFPMVIVSNFYGNLNAVLEDFGLKDLFGTVIESAVAGIRKPDAGIFRLGIDALSLPPAEILTVGDSYEKDIAPSIQLGINTIRLTTGN